MSIPFRMAAKESALPEPVPLGTCKACVSQSRIVQATLAAKREAEESLAAARSRIEDLTAAIEAGPPGLQAAESLRMRSHHLAAQEQIQRHRADDIERAMAAVIRDRDAAIRTAENLRRRLVAAGLTP